MKELNICKNKITEKQEVKPKDCINEVTERFKDDTAYVYAVLDYEVILGVYKGGKVYIGHRNDKGYEIIENVPMEYVKEFRVFDEEKEIRFIRSKGEFIMRFLHDEEIIADTENLEGSEDNMYCFNETQKIWGEVKEIKNGLQDDNDWLSWKALESKRGSKILFPILKNQGERDQCKQKKGVIIRQYLKFPNASEGEGVVQFIDERMVGFCDWEEGKETNE